MSALRISFAMGRDAFFLRSGLLEPALDRVERWGAPAEERATAIV